MAVNYETLFEDIGSIIASVNDIRSQDFETLKQHVFDTLGGNNSENTVTGIKDTFDSAKDRVVQGVQPVALLATERLTDRETVIDLLGATPDANVESIIFELIKAMNQDTPDPQTVDRSVVTVPTKATENTNNLGNGLIYLTADLDGVASPHPGFPPSLSYVEGGVSAKSELAVPNETISFTCTTDSDTNAVPRNEERFLVRGTPAWRTQWDWWNEGSGAELTVATDNAFGLMANGDFEAWTDAIIPESWELIEGVPGTSFSQNTDDALIVSGNSNLKVMQAFELQQIIPPQTLVPNRLYRLSLWTVGTTSTNVTVNFDIISRSGEVSIPSTPLTLVGSGPNAFTQTLLMPPNLADDMVIRLKSTAPDNDFYIDSMSLAPVNYINGIGFNIIAGSTAFTVDDRFTAEVTNAEKLVQQFFRRMYRIQLPSSATPTIPDSVAVLP